MTFEDEVATQEPISPEKRKLSHYAKSQEGFNIVRILITGGACAGKTSAVAAIQKNLK